MHETSSFLRPLYSIKHFKPRLNSVAVTLWCAIFLTLSQNNSLWKSILKVFDSYSFANIAFLASLFVVILLYINGILTLASFKYIFKPVLIIVLLTSAVASYFMDSYGILIDQSMIQNIMETNTAEARDLFSVQMVLHVALWGILPSFILYRTNIVYRPFLRELITKLGVIGISLVIIAIVAFVFYKDYSSLGRNNRHLRHLINPVNYLYSLGSYMKQSAGIKVVTIEPLEHDAKLADGSQQREKKTLFVFVLGETARADHFSLNGYSKNTNPALSKENIINFPNFHSCGTATAVSLPCIFSDLGREDYSDGYAKQHENLLDIIQHAGIQVLWRDNNTGCKGICQRIESENMVNLKVPDLCNDTECYDEILLHKLQERFEKLDRDMVIVLHQNGSHGPAYYLRYPEAFKKFTPVCETNQLQDCTQEEISNAYDNTILYTDYFLSKVINLLKNNSDRYNTAMMYLSDHGESLGENNLYLHGMPYFIAPETQTHVPFLAWLSSSFEGVSNLDDACIRQQQNSSLSHDNIFHSILGLLKIETAIYNPKFDIFAACIKKQ